MGLLEKMSRKAVLLDRLRDQPKPSSRMRVLGSFIHPDIDEIMGIESREWVTRDRRLKNKGIPMMGLGFAGLLQPNSEPVVAPSATTGVTSETNLYTPATTTNAGWALIPMNTLRSPQALFVIACGIITSSAGSQTVAVTSRIGTSATPSSNASLGATGAVALGSTITNALWVYNAFATVRALGSGTTATAVAHAEITISQQASGSATTAAIGMSGNTSATFDSTIQQGWVISVTPSASGVSAQLTQFALIAWD
jgi:hypothetical protein